MTDRIIQLDDCALCGKYRRRAHRVRGDGLVVVPDTLDMNDAPAAVWDDDRARRWVNLQGRYDTAFAPFNEVLMNATQPLSGQHILDVGCGAGSTLITFATAVGQQGQVVGVDIAEQMVIAARQRCAGAGLANVTVHCADAQVAAPPEAPFDAIVSRLGVMFFRDFEAAFTNLNSLTKPGGRLAFVCSQTFEDGPWSGVYQVLARYTGEFEHSSRVDPYRLANADSMKTLLRRSGYVDVTATSIEIPFVIGHNADDALEFVSSTGMLGGMLAATSEEDRSQARSDVLQLLRDHETVNGVEMRAKAWLVTAATSS